MIRRGKSNVECTQAREKLFLRIRKFQFFIHLKKRPKMNEFLSLLLSICLLTVEWAKKNEIEVSLYMNLRKVELVLRSGRLRGEIEIFIHEFSSIKKKRFHIPSRFKMEKQPSFMGNTSHGATTTKKS